MRSFLDIFVDWPMPLVWLLATALLTDLRGRGRRALAAAAALLVVSSAPIVGKALLAPLSRGAVAPDRVDVVGVAAILVPTAGSFRDAQGRWWPEDGSVRRVAAGLALQQRLALPLLVVGGAPFAAQPAEAETVVALLAPGRSNVRAVPEGNDTTSSAVAVAEVLAASGRRVVLLTDASHIARMRAALRHNDVAVAAAVRVPPSYPAALRSTAGIGWRDFVPARAGLVASGTAVHEYVGLAWYLVSGRIGISDL